MLPWATFLILTFYGTLIMFVALPPNPKLKKKYLSENVTLPEWNFWATSVHAEKKKNTRPSGENTALPHLSESCSVMSDSATLWTTQSTEFSRPEYWSGYLFPPPGDLPNPGIEPRSPHCGWILYQLSHKGSPRILEWVAYPFSSGSSSPRNRTGFSRIIISSYFWGLLGGTIDCFLGFPGGTSGKEPSWRYRRLKR